ncbi:LOW QUALITY PROTEIN: sodium-coupled monocarboxylate transporter 1-like [Ciona intestinalis]
MDVREFGTVDLIVFSASLLLTFLVGGYYAYKARRDDSVANYYFGNRKIPPIPLELSLAVTYISALTIIGVPTETYTYGMVNIWHVFATIIPSIFVCIYFIPLYYRLQLSTIYEYLEIRFNRKCRMFSSATEIINAILYMGITVYLPSLVLSAVTPISTHVAIILTSVICTIYTVCGGLKAIVWTDTLQSGVMFFGGLAFIIKAILVVGGFGEIAAALERGNRNNIFDLNLDPKFRQSFWSLVIGSFTHAFYPLACSQPSVQRLMSCKSIKDARIAMIVSNIPKVLITLISVGCGAAAYAYYEHCDPLSSGQISKPDQLIPFMAVDIFNSIPGMAGLFVAGVYSGTLSTVSSGINSASAMILEDFILPIKPSLSEKSQLFLSKITGLILGVMVISMAYLCSLSSNTVTSLLFVVRGTCSGPILGAYILGLIFPWCTGLGVLMGQFIGAAFTCWIAVGGLVYGRDPATDGVLPVLTDGCENTNFTTNNEHWNVTQGFTTTNLLKNSSNLFGARASKILRLIRDNIFYYYSIGSIITIIVGLLVSIITGANDPRKSNPDVFVPILDNKCFPESLRHFFRFGVPSRKTGCGKDEVNYETDDVGEEVGIKLQQTNHPESSHSDETKALNVDI